MKDSKFQSRLLTITASITAVSGLVMALCGAIGVGGCFWVAASCMFFGASQIG